jgi:hypothetical protein
MEISGAKRLRALEDENAKLKRMLAEAMPNNVAFNVRAFQPAFRRAFS